MPVFDVIQSMASRVPWPVGSLVLYQAKLERGRGWGNTADKYRNPSTKALQAEGHLLDALSEHHLFGEKLVSYFQVSPSALSTFRSALSKVVPGTNAAKSVYPLHLSSSALSAFPRTPTLVDVNDTPTALSLVFTSARETTIREPVDISSLPAAAARQLDDYEEVVGVRKIRFQAFDVIAVPKKDGPIEVRTDFPYGTLVETALAAQQAVRGAAEALSQMQPFGTRLNLFPLMDKFYQDANEGTVVELAFATSTGSTKHEKMRRAGLDLRQEIYHKAGMAALTAPIEPYKLSVVWAVPLDKKRSSYPELSLNSTSRVSGAVSPALGTVVIRKCRGAEDFEYVQRRIYRHL